MGCSSAWGPDLCAHIHIQAHVSNVGTGVVTMLVMLVPCCTAYVPPHAARSTTEVSTPEYDPWKNKLYSDKSGHNYILVATLVMASIAAGMHHPH
jgi:ABC-type cobalt transport system substrate-binding protein